jgi:ankyrin repeat protein
MGQGSSTPHPNDALRRQFSGWTLEQMRLSYKRYKEITIRFSVPISQFADMLALDETGEETAAAFRLFSTKRSPTMVDALEVLSGVCMFSDASLAEKIEFIFTIYDFNGSQTLTPDELTILMRSTTRALAKIGGTSEPTKKDIERLCDEAFSFADIGSDGHITQTEFSQWASNKRVLLDFLGEISGDVRVKIYVALEKDHRVFGCIEFANNEELTSVHLDRVRQMLEATVSETPARYQFLKGGHALKREAEERKTALECFPFCLLGTPGLHHDRKRMQHRTNKRRAQRYESAEQTVQQLQSGEDGGNKEKGQGAGDGGESTPTSFQYSYRGERVLSLKQRLPRIRPVCKRYGTVLPRIKHIETGKACRAATVERVTSWVVATNWAGEWVFGQEKVGGRMREGQGASKDKSAASRRLRMQMKRVGRPGVDPQLLVKDHRGKIVKVFGDKVEKDTEVGKLRYVETQLRREQRARAKAGLYNDKRSRLQAMHITMFVDEQQGEEELELERQEQAFATIREAEESTEDSSSISSKTTKSTKSEHRQGPKLQRPVSGGSDRSRASQSTLSRYLDDRVAFRQVDAVGEAEQLRQAALTRTCGFFHDKVLPATDHAAAGDKLGVAVAAAMAAVAGKEAGANVAAGEGGKAKRNSNGLTYLSQLQLEQDEVEVIPVLLLRPLAELAPEDEDDDAAAAALIGGDTKTEQTHEPRAGGVSGGRIMLVEGRYPAHPIYHSINLSFMEHCRAGNMDAVVAAVLGHEMTVMATTASMGGEVHAGAPPSHVIAMNQQDSLGRSCMHAAAEEGHWELIDFLIKHRVEAGRRDWRGQTALHYASAKGHLRAVNSFLQAGVAHAVADVQGKTPLHLALETEARKLRAVAAIDRLISRQDEELMADVPGSGTGVARGKKNGANKNGPSAAVVAEAARAQRPDSPAEKRRRAATEKAKMVEKLQSIELSKAPPLAPVPGLPDHAAGLLSRSSTGSSRHKSRAAGEAKPKLLRRFHRISETVQALWAHAVTHGAGAALELEDEEAETPRSLELAMRGGLIHACAKGDLGRVQHLVTSGKAPELNVTMPELGGRTALHEACHHGHLQVADFVLNCGAELTPTDWKGQTPLHYAATSSNVAAADVTKGLLAMGSAEDTGVGMRDCLGRTPLIAALYARRLRPAALLVQQAIDDPIAARFINTQDEDGYTALHVCCAVGAAGDCEPNSSTVPVTAKHVVQLLLRAGADPNRRVVILRAPKWHEDWRHTMAQRRTLNTLGSSVPMAQVKTGKYEVLASGGVQLRRHLLGSKWKREPRLDWLLQLKPGDEEGNKTGPVGEGEQEKEREREQQEQERREREHQEGKMAGSAVHGANALFQATSTAFEGRVEWDVGNGPPTWRVRVASVLACAVRACAGSLSTGALQEEQQAQAKSGIGSKGASGRRRSSRSRSDGSGGSSNLEILALLLQAGAEPSFDTAKEVGRDVGGEGGLVPAAYTKGCVTSEAMQRAVGAPSLLHLAQRCCRAWLAAQGGVWPASAAGNASNGAGGGRAKEQYKTILKLLLTGAAKKGKKQRGGVDVNCTDKKGRTVLLLECKAEVAWWAMMKDERKRRGGRKNSKAASAALSRPSSAGGRGASSRPQTPTPTSTSTPVPGAAAPSRSTAASAEMMARHDGSTASGSAGKHMHLRKKYPVTWARLAGADDVPSTSNSSKAVVASALVSVQRAGARALEDEASATFTAREAAEAQGRGGGACLEAVALLLQNNADPNVTDDDGLTPIGAASVAGTTALVRILLEAGADPAVGSNLQINKARALADLPTVKQPILLAAAAGHAAVLQLLLGVDTASSNNAAPPSGITASLANSHEYGGLELTALHLTAAAGHAQAAEVLLAAGADVGALGKAAEVLVFSLDANARPHGRPGSRGNMPGSPNSNLPGSPRSRGSGGLGGGGGSRPSTGLSGDSLVPRTASAGSRPSTGEMSMNRGGLALRQQSPHLSFGLDPHPHDSAFAVRPWSHVSDQARSDQSGSAGNNTASWSDMQLTLGTRSEHSTKIGVGWAEGTFAPSGAGTAAGDSDGTSPLDELAAELAPFHQKRSEKKLRSGVSVLHCLLLAAPSAPTEKQREGERAAVEQQLKQQQKQQQEQQQADPGGLLRGNSFADVCRPYHSGNELQHAASAAEWELLAMRLVLAARARDKALATNESYVSEGGELSASAGLLCTLGADGRDALLLACRRRYWRLATLMLEDDEDTTDDGMNAPSRGSSRGSSKGSSRGTSSRGGRSNFYALSWVREEDGTSALHLAAAEGQNALVELLLERGASANARALLSGSRFLVGPAYLAAVHAHLECLLTLIEAGDAILHRSLPCAERARVVGRLGRARTLEGLYELLEPWPLGVAMLHTEADYQHHVRALPPAHLDNYMHVDPALTAARGQAGIFESDVRRYVGLVSAAGSKGSNGLVEAAPGRPGIFMRTAWPTPTRESPLGVPSMRNSEVMSLELGGTTTASVHHSLLEKGWANGAVLFARGGSSGLSTNARRRRTVVALLSHWQAATNWRGMGGGVGCCVDERVNKGGDGLHRGNDTPQGHTPSPHQRRGRGRGLLAEEAARGNTKLVELLLDHGSSPVLLDAWGESPLSEAARGGTAAHVATLEAMLKYVTPVKAAMGGESPSTTEERAAGWVAQAAKPLVVAIREAKQPTEEKKQHDPQAAALVLVEFIATAWKKDASSQIGCIRALDAADKHQIRPIEAAAARGWLRVGKALVHAGATVTPKALRACLCAEGPGSWMPAPLVFEQSAQAAMGGVVNGADEREGAVSSGKGMTDVHSADTDAVTSSSAKTGKADATALGADREELLCVLLSERKMADPFHRPTPRLTLSADGFGQEGSMEVIAGVHDLVKETSIRTTPSLRTDWLFQGAAEEATRADAAAKAAKEAGGIAPATSAASAEETAAMRGEWAAALPPPPDASASKRKLRRMVDCHLNTGVIDSVKRDFRVHLRKTLLLLACERGFWRAALMLLDCMHASGVADHAVPEEGCVHLAAKAGKLVLLRRLLECGADSNSLWADPFVLWRQEQEVREWQSRRADSLVADAFKSREERALRIRQASSPPTSKKKEALARGDGVAAVRAKRKHNPKGPHAKRTQVQQHSALSVAMKLAAGLRKRSGYYGVRSCGAPTKLWNEQHWSDVATSAAHTVMPPKEDEEELELQHPTEPVRWSAWLHYNGQHRRVGSALTSAEISAVYTPQYSADKARTRTKAKEKAKQKVSAKAKHLGGLGGGVFNTKEEAAAAYDAAVRRWYGNGSGVKYNFPMQDVEDGKVDENGELGANPARRKLAYGETVLLDTAMRGSELRRRLQQKKGQRQSFDGAGFGLSLALSRKALGGSGGSRTLRSQWYKGAIKVGPLYYAIRHGQLAAALLLVTNPHGRPANVESLQPILTRDKIHCGRSTFRMPRRALGEEGTQSYRPAGRTPQNALECIGTWHWSLPLSAVGQWAEAAGITRLPAARAATIGFGGHAVLGSRPSTPAGVNADRGFGRRCFPPYHVGQPLHELHGALHMHLRMYEELGGEGEVGGRAVATNRMKAAEAMAQKQSEEARRPKLIKSAPQATAAPTVAASVSPTSVFSATAPLGTEDKPMSKLEMAKAKRAKTPDPSAQEDPMLMIAMAAEQAAVVRATAAATDETMVLFNAAANEAKEEEKTESALLHSSDSSMVPLPKSASSAARFSASTNTYGYVPSAAELLEQRALGWLLDEREELQQEGPRKGSMEDTREDESRPSTSDVASAVGRRVVRMQGAQSMHRSEWIRCGSAGETAGWRSDAVLLSCNQPRCSPADTEDDAANTGAFGAFERRLLKQLVEHMLSASLHAKKNKGHSLLHEEAGRAGRAGGSPGMVALLLEAGLQPDVYDQHGMSPLARAIEAATVPTEHRTPALHPLSNTAGQHAGVAAAYETKAGKPSLRGADGAHASLLVGTFIKHGASVLPPQLDIEEALLKGLSDASRLVKAQYKSSKMAQEKQDLELIRHTAAVSPLVVACRTGKFGGAAEIDPWATPLVGTSAVDSGGAMVNATDTALKGRAAAAEKTKRGAVLGVFELVLQAMNDVHSPQARAADASAKGATGSVSTWGVTWAVRRERALQAGVLTGIHHARLGFQRAVVRLLGELVVGASSGTGTNSAAPKGALLAALKLRRATIESCSPFRYSNSCRLSRGGKRRSATGVNRVAVGSPVRGSPRRGRENAYEHGLSPDAKTESETAEFEWMCIQLLNCGAVANDEIDSIEEKGANDTGVRTALLYACERGLWRLALAMLEQVAPDGSKCVTGGGLDRTGALRGSDKLASLMKAQQRCEPLHLAIMAGEEEVVTQMLSLGADLCALDKNRMNAVHHVACLGERRVAGAVMLHAAPLEECDDLLVAADSQGRTPLHVAAASGHKWMVAYLLGMCQPVPIDNPTAGPSVGGGGRAGLDAVGSSEADMVSTSRFFQQVLNVRCAKGLSIAAHAAINGHMEITRMMMSEHAYDPSTEAANGDSLVLSVARTGKMAAVLWLLNLGTQAARRMKLVGDDGYTILHWAALWGAVPLTRYLFDNADIGNKALVNVQEENGYTPLHFAYAYGRREIVRLLLDNSADPDVHSLPPLELVAADDVARTQKAARLAASSELTQARSKMRGTRDDRLSKVKEDQHALEKGMKPSRPSAPSGGGRGRGGRGRGGRTVKAAPDQSPPAPDAVVATGEGALVDQASGEDGAGHAELREAFGFAPDHWGAPGWFSCMLQAGVNPVTAARRFAKKGAGGDADISLAIESNLAAPMSMTLTMNATAMAPTNAFGSSNAFGTTMESSSVFGQGYSMFKDDAGVYYRDLNTYRYHSFAAVLEDRIELRNW